MEKIDIELKKHKFIVFSHDHYNPLGIIRSLGEKGFNPILILITFGRKKHWISTSRYLSEVNYVDSPEEGLFLLVEKYSQEQHKPFVYTSSDDVASLLDKNQEKLTKSFYFFHGRKSGVISDAMNKRIINEIALKHGLDVLQFESVKHGELPKGLRYPIITKAISPTLLAWKGDMHICHNEQELIEAYKKIRSEEVLVQEFIEKKNEFCMDGFAYNYGKNVEIPYFTNYLRFTDLSYGGAMILRPFEKGEIYHKISSMLEEIGYTGIFEAELLVDKDDKLHFLEINLRNSTWSYAYTYGGYNMPYLWAKATLQGSLDLNGITPMKQILALSESDDYIQEIVEHKKNFLKWMWNIRNYDCFYCWNKKDLKPSLSYWIPLFTHSLIKMFLPEIIVNRIREIRARHTNS